MMKKFLQKKNGFALLYTVVVVSLILTIAIGISNTTYRQTILSSLAKDSQIAFYQADTGIECAMYYDLNPSQFKFTFNMPVASAPASISCGANSATRDDTQSAVNHYVYKQTLGASIPCFIVSIDKVATSTTIQGRGHSMCGSGPRQVERALQVTY